MLKDDQFVSCEVAKLAAQFGLDTPKEIYTGPFWYLLDRVTQYGNGVTNYEDSLKEFEQYLSVNYMDKYSYLDDSVIEEGIVLRVEKYGKPDLYKMKAPEFLIHEGKQADKQVLDIETAES